MWHSHTVQRFVFVKKCRELLAIVLPPNGDVYAGSSVRVFGVYFGSASACSCSQCYCRRTEMHFTLMSKSLVRCCLLAYAAGIIFYGSYCVPACSRVYGCTCVVNNLVFGRLAAIPFADDYAISFKLVRRSLCQNMELKPQLIPQSMIFSSYPACALCFRRASRIFVALY